MKYAILSDIHGNLEALNAVLAKCREEGVVSVFKMFAFHFFLSIERKILDSFT